jgi:hypothetical protein
MKIADNPLLKRCTGKPAILDSNLLSLHWCAGLDPSLMVTFKRFNRFRVEDIDLLSETISLFSAIRTTPHVFTELDPDNANM